MKTNLLQKLSSKLATTQNTPAQPPRTSAAPAMPVRDTFVSPKGVAQIAKTLSAGLKGVASVGRQNFTSGLSINEQRAMEHITRASDSGDAKPIVDWLRANPDAASQDALMDLLFQERRFAGSILNNTQNLSDSDRALLAEALDHAYRAGAITDEELSQAIGGAYGGELRGETHEELASIIAETGNPDLIATYAKRELEILSDERHWDPQRAAAVATALSGMSPDALQAFLKGNPEGMEKVLENINQADFGPERSPALGLLLDAAAAITPATAESIKLFADAVPHLGENADSRAAAARFFSEHGDAIINEMQDASGSLGLDGQKRLSEFFTRTLFSPPQDYEGAEAFRESVMERLGALQETLEARADENPPSLEAKRAARELGSLVGALEGGFQIAIDELNKRNEAVDGMADLLFSAKDLLPDLPIPGAGKLVELSLDQLQDWASSQFKENPDSPSDAIPFHRAFGEIISHPDLRTDYDAARADAFLNRERGLS